VWLSHCILFILVEDLIVSRIALFLWVVFLGLKMMFWCGFGGKLRRHKLR